MERKREDWMHFECTKCGKDISKQSDVTLLIGKCDDCFWIDEFGITFEEHRKKMEEEAKLKPVEVEVEVEVEVKKKVNLDDWFS